MRDAPLIDVRRGELAEATAAAILRPVSAEWEAVTAVSRRVELAAGDEVGEQCRRFGELPVGSAMITPGGKLGAQFLIHAIVRSRDEAVRESIVYRALQNGLRRAAEWGVESLAMPPLGTGAGNLDAEDAAGVMVPVLVQHMAESPHPAQVQIVVETDYELEAFRTELRSAGVRLEDDPSPATG